jgi:ubiquinone/menaquinone biosynthesis C-methylase UbiE
VAPDPLAERGFGATYDAALVYERGRPGYAPAIVPLLVAELGLNASARLLDLAAGTGQLARLFAPVVGSVVAVEPSEAMRRVLAERLPGVEVLEGLAERLPLADGSLDAAVVGNAFHWFDGPAAVRELARVLRPGGGLAIVWNVGRDTEPPAPELAAFVERLRTGMPRERRSESGAWRDALEASDRFAPLACRTLTHERELDRERFTAYLGSLAVIAALPAAERDAALEDIRSLAPARCRLKMRTECFWTRRRAAR